LYGKPLQLLDLEEGVSILDHIIALTRTVRAIDTTVLGVAEGAANDVFVNVAKTHGIESIRGSERDVLARLITCGASAAATDVFRITTESPYFHFEMIDEVWARHTENSTDVTVVDGLPEGCHEERPVHPSGPRPAAEVSGGLPGSEGDSPHRARDTARMGSYHNVSACRCALEALDQEYAS